MISSLLRNLDLATDINLMVILFRGALYLAVVSQLIILIDCNLYCAIQIGQEQNDVHIYNHDDNNSDIIK